MFVGGIEFDTDLGETPEYDQAVGPQPCTRRPVPGEWEDYIVESIWNDAEWRP